MGLVLAVDIGNTNVKCGVYAGETLVEHWRVSTDRKKTADEYGLLLMSLFGARGLARDGIEAIVACSVVPPVTPAFEEMGRRYFGLEPLFVGPGVKTGISVKYENPKEIGADRIADAVAAVELYKPPLIVVDFGTATTFGAINRNAEYLGGVITPGIWTSTEALFEHAAKLGHIELQATMPKSVIGRNAVAAMQSGIVYGAIGQVNEIVRRMKAEMNEDAFVVATGGLAEVVAQESPVIDAVNQWLTLEGLRLIYEKNRD